jgi:hypothetical protein
VKAAEFRGEITSLRKEMRHRSKFEEEKVFCLLNTSIVLL